MLDAKAEELMAKVNKIVGPGTFIRASEFQMPCRFTSGSLGLDVILGGGFPGNQWTEIVGKYSSGKTAMVLKAIASNQVIDSNFTALWVAAEPFDAEQAAALGVDLDRLILQPHGQEMEVAFQVMLAAAESRAVDCIVLDSYPALVADEEAEKSMSEDTVAKGARLFSRFCRKGGKATRRAYDGSERPMFGVIVNQYRDKIGSFSRFGTTQTTPGGNAKDYYFWARVEVARDEWIEEKRPGYKIPVTVGQTMKFRMIKNKGAAPRQTARVDFYFRGAPTLGFRRGDYDLAGECFSVGILYRVIRRSGGWYYFGDNKWQGESRTLDALRSEPELLHAVRAQVLEKTADPRALDMLDEVD